MKRGIFVFIFILIIAILFLVLKPFRTAPPILIGATMSETGAFSAQGLAARNGYLLFQDHINEQGGILGRKVRFIIYDDKSDTDTAAALYERLITEDGVDLVMGPYGSTLTEAVAPVTERHRQVMISPLAASGFIWDKGHRYLFMQLTPAELFLGGLIEMAYGYGLRKVAIIYEDAQFPAEEGTGAAELVKEKGMDLVVRETYPPGTDDFSALLEMIREAGADVLGMSALSTDDYIAIVRQMKELDINVKMFGAAASSDQFQEELGDAAEYTYGLLLWDKGLPHPGIDQFSEAYRKEYNTEPTLHAAGAYGGCQILAEATELAGALDSELIREELLSLETQTIFGKFSVDERGYQVANRGVFIQWQDGEKVVVWPEEFATAKPRFPAPPWSER